MSSLPVRLFHASVIGMVVGLVISLAATYGVSLLLANNDTSGGFRGYGSVTHIPPSQRGTGIFGGGNPSETDWNGDGIPNEWEEQHGHGTEQEDVVALDFDFDGLTTKQEYDLFQRTAGQYGNPIGKYAITAISRPSGFTRGSLFIEAVASNGRAAISFPSNVGGQRPFTYDPDTGVWTQISPVPGHESWRMKANDINSQGVLVGTLTNPTSGAVKGFIWSPSPSNSAVWQSRLFLINPNSTSPESAIPKRIGDTGYFVYSTTAYGIGRAADPKQRKIEPISNTWTTPDFVDVNDFGEYVGLIYHPMDWSQRCFLAIPGGPFYLSEMSAWDLRLGNFAQMDFSAISWEVLSEYDEEGNWLDLDGQYEYGEILGSGIRFRRQWGSSEIWSSYDGVTWEIAWASDSSPPSLLNDWGEFIGYYSGGVVQQEEDSESYSYSNHSGSYFYDGWYHPLNDTEATFTDMSNDPQVLSRTPYEQYRLWSDNIICPLSRMLPPGYPAPFDVRLFDNCRFYIKKNSSTLEILQRSDDADGDGMPDDWEVFYGLDPDQNDANGDMDGDGVSNHGEFLLRRDPAREPILDGNGSEIDTRAGIDTDGDGMPNSWEVANGMNYNDASDAGLDFDRDGYTNLQEYRLNTDPRGAPSYRIHEPGPFPNTRYANLPSAILGLGRPFETCLQPANGSMDDSLFFSVQTNDGSWWQHPAFWRKTHGAPNGSMSVYPALPSGTQSYDLVSAPSGACIQQKYGSPYMMFYWPSSVATPVVLSGESTQHDIRSLTSSVLSPSGTYLAATRLSNTSGYELILWKLPGSSGQTWKPVKLTPPAGISLNVWQRLSINDYGYALGNGTNASGQSVPVLWKLNAAATATTSLVLPALPGGSWSRAVGLTNHPSPIIAGTSSISGGQTRATVWNSSANATSLGALPSGTFSEILTVSPAGYLAGKANTLVDGILRNMPFIAAPVGGTTHNAPSPSDYRLMAQGTSAPDYFNFTEIADSGELIGSSFQYSPEFKEFPMLWKNGRAYALDAIFPQASGYNLDSIVSINSNGTLLARAWKDGAQTTLLLTADQDTDGDGMPDAYENQHGFNPFIKIALTADSDSDGLTDIDEYRYGTNPRNPDSDNDGMKDGWEATWGLLPLDATDAGLDPDGDRVTNLKEFQLGTTPTGVYKITTRLTDAAGSYPYVMAASDSGRIIHSGQDSYNQGTTPDGLQFWSSTQEMSALPAFSALHAPPTILPSFSYAYAYSSDWSQYSYSSTSPTYYPDPSNGKINGFIQSFSYSYGGSEYEYLDSAFLLPDAESRLDEEDWIAWETVQQTLRVTTGAELPVLSSDETLSSWPEAVSPSGTHRIHRTSNWRPIMLDASGSFLCELPMGPSWQAVNNLGNAAAASGTYVPDTAEHAGYTIPEVIIHTDGTDRHLPIPYTAGVDCYAAVIAFSDDGMVLVSVQSATASGSEKLRYYLLDSQTGIATLVRQPCLGSEAINFLSNRNGRLLGSGPRPFQLTPDGTCLRLDAMRIKNTPAESPVPLGTLYPRTMTPDHIASNGTITLTTTNSSGQTVILQITPNNDSDGNGLPDDWENAFNLTDHDGDEDGDGLSNAEEFVHGTDIFARDSDGDGMTDAHEVRAGLNPLSRDQNGNGQTDGYEDWDNDGYINLVELLAGTPHLDGDKRPDGQSTDILVIRSFITDFELRTSNFTNVGWQGPEPDILKTPNGFAAARGYRSYLKKDYRYEAITEITNTGESKRQSMIESSSDRLAPVIAEVNGALGLHVNSTHSSDYTRFYRSSWSDPDFGSSFIQYDEAGSATGFSNADGAANSDSGWVATINHGGEITTLRSTECYHPDPNGNYVIREGWELLGAREFNHHYFATPDCHRWTYSSKGTEHNWTATSKEEMKLSDEYTPEAFHGDAKAIHSLLPFRSPTYYWDACAARYSANDGWRNVSYSDAKYSLKAEVPPNVTKAVFIWREISTADTNPWAEPPVNFAWPAEEETWFEEAIAPQSAAAVVGNNEARTSVRNLSYPEKGGIRYPALPPATTLNAPSILAVDRDSFGSSPDPRNLRPIRFNVETLHNKHTISLIGEGTGQVQIWKKTGNVAAGQAQFTKVTLPVDLDVEQKSGPWSQLGNYYVQGIQAGDVTLKLQGPAASPIRTTVIRVVDLDLDVDSDSTGEIDSTDEEDRIEADTSKPGKVIIEGDAAESNEDGIPLHPDHLVALKLRTANLPPGSTLTLDYRNSAVRIWRTPPSQTPSQSDLLVPGQPYILSELGLTPGSTAEFSIQSLGTTSGLLQIGVASEEARDEVLVNLLPVEVVQGELGTESENVGNWLMTEADPKPEVEMEITDAVVSGSDVVVSVQGTVTDHLSKFGETAGEKVQTLKFIVDGVELHSINVSNGVETGFDFNETVTIPNAKPRGYTLRAETSENLAGNTGWDQVAVGLNLAKSPTSFSSSGSEFSIAFNQIPSNGTVDTAKVYFGNRAPLAGDLTVTETAADSSQFEGQVKVSVGGQTHSVPCIVMIKGANNLAVASVDDLFAEISYTHPSLGVNRLYGRWRETANSSLTFGSSGYQGGDETLLVEAMVNLPGSQKEHFEPITMRINGPDDWADSDTVKIKVGDTEYPLKKFTFNGNESLYPYDEAYADEPKQFLPSAKAVPQKLQTPGYTAGGGSYDFKLKIDATEHDIQTVQVQRGFRDDFFAASPPVVAAQAAPGPLAMQAQAVEAGWKEPGDKVTMADLLTAYKWIYGTNEDAMTLLRAFQENGNIITLGDELGGLDVNYILRTDNKIEIEIEDDDNDVNPVVCANLLHAGLYQALAYPPLNNHPEVADNINLFVASRTAFAQTAAEITSTAAEMYLSGISLANDGLDFILVINEVAEGNYMALAGALPIVPVGAVKLGSKAIRIQSNTGLLIGEITDPLQLSAISRASKKRVFADKMVIYEEAGVPEGIIAMLVRGGEIETSKAHKTLKARMKAAGRDKPGESFEAHHDLPWEFKREFAEAKIDVNEEVYGRWVHENDHKLWHYNDPKFNDVWYEFFYQEIGGGLTQVVRTKAEILTKLAEIRSSYVRTITE